MLRPSPTGCQDRAARPVGWLRAVILLPYPGLAARPPSRYTLKQRTDERRWTLAHMTVFVIPTSCTDSRFGIVLRGRLRLMVLEHALLSVRPGREYAFETAFARARPLLEATPGFCCLRISRSVESPSTYLLLVEWDTVESHMEGFRGSERYQPWRDLLHHFYDPFPVWSTSG